MNQPQSAESFHVPHSDMVMHSTGGFGHPVDSGPVKVWIGSPYESPIIAVAFNKERGGFVISVNRDKLTSTTMRGFAEEGFIPLHTDQQPASK